MTRTNFSRPAYSKLTLALAAALTGSTLSAAALANPEPLPEPQIERLQVIGSKQAVNELPGSGYYMDEEELAEFEYTDVMRALGNIPGVYVLEEDGFGLRPNIGMRGTGVNRADKITQMEDGVLSAPAPYAAPAAYYFPTFARVQALEVLKGSSAVQYGPRTTGGVLNVVSRQIPEAPFAGFADLSLGEHGYGKAHAYAGGEQGQWGGVAEVLRYQADGFKTVPNGDTGFERNDIMGKLRYDLTGTGAHQFELKYKFSDETSDETYMGITEDDYRNAPFVRYAASQQDVMNTEHTNLQLSHQWNLENGSRVTTTAYRNEFDRNWYKTDRVGGLSLGGGGTELASFFDRNASGDDTLDVRVKNNNRAYISQGIQSQYETNWQQHDLVAGVRIHEDEEDRYQWVDMYQLDANLLMTLTDADVPGTDANRVSSAEAFAAFAKGRFYFGDLTIDAGARLEDVDTKRQDWSDDLARANAPAQRTNSTSQVLPAVGATYRLSDATVLLAGVQKGFSPASPGNEGQENEESWNYEAGIRFVTEQSAFEAIGFYSDYENMHGNCTAAQGCDLGNIGAQTNAGEVKVSGFEFLGQYQLPVTAAINASFDAAYTYTNAEFQNSFSSNIGIWGDVTAGDKVPYQPEQQLRLGAGLAGDNWSTSLNARYVGGMQTTAGTDEDAIAGRTIFDLAARYNIRNNQNVYLTVDNLTDKTYITTRMHGGIMVGKPRSVNIGYQLRF